MQTRVQRWGNSLAVRIPKVFADDLGLADDGAVELTLSDGKLVVSPTSSPKLADLLAGITKKNLHDAQDWGAPAGKEVW
jgi:antitoxin MazE